MFLPSTKSASANPRWNAAPRSEILRETPVGRSGCAAKLRTRRGVPLASAQVRQNERVGAGRDGGDARRGKRRAGEALGCEPARGEHRRNRGAEGTAGSLLPQ